MNYSHILQYTIQSDNQKKLTCPFRTRNFEVFLMMGYDRYYQRLSEEAYEIGKKLGIKNIEPEKIDEYYKLLEEKQIKDQ